MNNHLYILYIITIFIFTSCAETEFEYFDNCTYYNNEFYCKTKTHEDLKDSNDELNENVQNNSVNITEIIIPSEKEKPNNEELNTENKKDFYFSNIEELNDNQSLLIEIPSILYNDVKYLDYYGLISFSINNTDKTLSIILYDIDVNMDDLMNSSKKTKVNIFINKIVSNEINKLINELLGDWPYYFFSLKEIIYKNNRLELVYSITDFIIV